MFELVVVSVCSEGSDQEVTSTHSSARLAHGDTLEVRRLTLVCVAPLDGPLPVCALRYEMLTNRVL